VRRGHTIGRVVLAGKRALPPIVTEQKPVKKGMDPAFFDLDRSVFILALVGPHPLLRRRWAQAANRESGSGFGRSNYLSRIASLQSRNQEHAVRYYRQTSGRRHTSYTSTTSHVMLLCWHSRHPPLSGLPFLPAVRAPLEDQ